MINDAFLAAKKHALAAFPHESCGVIINGAYVACTNVADDPENDFEIDTKEYLAVTGGRKPEFVVHSHPNGPRYPSERDMQTQIALGVPFAIIQTNGEIAPFVEKWGDSLPIEPLIGRPFMHGIRDCYSVIRDAYRLGNDALSKQGVTNDWTLEPYVMPEVPRDDGWWAKGKDLYTENFKPFGFSEVVGDIKPGDIFMKALLSDRLNHGGVYLGNNLILHHLPTKLSRREPFGLWGRSADLWVRRDA